MSRESFSELIGEELIISVIHRNKGSFNLEGVLDFASTAGDFEINSTAGYNKRSGQRNLVAPDYAIYMISDSNGGVIMKNPIVPDRYKKHNPIVREHEFPEIEQAEIWTV